MSAAPLVIYKYTLPLAGHEQTIVVPLKCHPWSFVRVLRFAFQGRELVCWVEHPATTEGRDETRNLILICRFIGHAYLSHVNDEYVGGADDPATGLVRHFFTREDN